MDGDRVYVGGQENGVNVYDITNLNAVDPIRTIPALAPVFNIRMKPSSFAFVNGGNSKIFLPFHF